MIDLALVRRGALEVATPFLKVAGMAHVPPHYRSVTAVQYAVALGHLRPGDVLVSHRNREPTNLLIPGYWKHAAIYVGDGRIVEAIGRGVLESSLKEFCTTKDDVLILRARFATQEEAALSCAFAKSLLGKPYDYLVEHDQSRAVNKAFYCSEIVWWSYDQVLIAEGKPSPFTPRKTLGVPTITPQDYPNATDKWSEVARLKGKAA